MTVVKKGDGNIGFGGKPLPPEGEQKYVFNGTAELVGKTKQMLKIEAEYALDPDSTAPVTCLCWLANEKGLEALMSIIMESGVYKKLMAKDKSLPDPAEGWDDEQILLKPEFIEQLGIELVGCSAYITIEHFDDEWKDEEKGTTQKRRKSRVISIRAFDGKVKSNPDGGKPKGKAGETPGEWDK